MRTASSRRTHIEASFMALKLCIAFMMGASMALAGVELNPTIMLLGSMDWLPTSVGGSSRCIESVRRAAKVAGGSRLNFVPTMYWRDSFPADGTVDSYCYRESKKRCAPFTAAAIASFRTHMQRCFQAAVDLGMDISVVPHLDDGSFESAWRNGLIFSPTAKYGGYSYEDVMLNPLADALRAVMTPTTRVWMAMQGEMSATICRYPADYIGLHQRLKLRIAGTDTVRLTNVKVGVALNFNKLEAGNGGSPIDIIFSLFLGRLPVRKPAIDRANLLRLFQVVEFVGISGYAALVRDFKEDELQTSAFMFFDEFKKIGIDLASIMQARGTELHYTEFGIGGGTSGDGKVPAYTPEQAAHTPFFGVWGSYHRSDDPWARPAVRDYMRSFYARTLHWLERNGGPTHHISACFLWDLGSWDVLGVYPESSTKEGSFRDEVVSAMVRQHNARVSQRAPVAMRQTMEVAAVATATSTDTEKGTKRPNKRQG